jgi:VanZ family protein
MVGPDMSPCTIARHPAPPAVLLALWTAGLFFVSSLPGTDVSLPTFPFADKVAHLVYFGAGGFLLAWLLRGVVPWSPWRVLTAVGLAFAVIGAVDEFHQLFTPGRMGADPGDWLADVLGALAGAGFFLTLYGLLTRRSHPAAPAGN